MKFLYRFRIKTKLLFLVGILVVGIIYVGVLGVIYIQKSAASLDDIYNNHLQSIENLADLRTQTRANYANIMNLCISDSGDERTKILDDYNKREKTIDADIEAVSKLELSSDELASLDSAKTKLEAWRKIAKTITDSANANDTQGAIATFKSEGAPAFEDLQNDVRSIGKNQMTKATASYKASDNINTNANLVLSVTSILIVVIASSLGFLISTSITQPIQRLVGLIRRTADLNLTYDKSFEIMLYYKDEIGDITKAVGDMRKSLRETATNLHTISETLAANSQELASQAEENEKAIQQNATSISEIAQGNTSQAHEITKATEAITDIASHVASISEASESNSENVKNSLHIIKAGQQAVKVTVEKIEDNIRVSNEVNESIHELSEQMNKVGDIVTVIREISSRTNLLALNASIEAARAGEAGKGFAVVASEIGALAQNTNSSVDDINAIIQGAIVKNSLTSDKVTEVRQIVSEQENSIKVMEESFSKIKEAINDIADQSEDITHKISTVTVTTDNMSNRMSDMSAIAEETAAGSEQISAASEEQLASVEFLTSVTGNLATMAETLNQEISKFKL